MPSSSNDSTTFARNSSRQVSVSFVEFVSFEVSALGASSVLFSTTSAFDTSSAFCSTFFCLDCSDTLSTFLACGLSVVFVVPFALACFSNFLISSWEGVPE